IRLEQVGHVVQHARAGLLSLEAMCEAWRDVNGTTVALRELHRAMPQEAGRVRPQVHHDIEHRATDATHQLALARWRPLKVQTAHRALPVVAREARLHERPRNTSISELARAEHAHEIAARIGEQVGFDDADSFERCRAEFHTSLPTELVVDLSRAGQIA